MSWVPSAQYTFQIDPHRDNRIPEEHRSFLVRELHSEERLLWVGQPRPGSQLWTTIPIVLFGIPWTAFALFWVAGASGFRWPDFSKGGFAFFPLFGVPFVLIGLGMLSSPFWMWRKAKNTLYVVTNRRVIIFEKGRGMTITSYTKDQMSKLTRTEKADGSGNLFFSEQVTKSNDDTRTTQVGFYGIEEVHLVETLIRDNILIEGKKDS